MPAHDIGTGSPACKGHSRARGKEKPVHDIYCSTAWVIVSCAEVHREKAWVVENVPEFLQWTLFPAWKSAMEALGYAVSPPVARDVIGDLLRRL